jgi:hypothetical protein
MKKIALLILIALAGCTAVEMPHICKSSNRKNYKIRTSGKMNGYSVSEDEIIEGRTKGANYKRLLLNNGKKEIMTKYAYDCEKQAKILCYKLHIWGFIEAEELYDCLNMLKYDSDYDESGISHNIFPTNDLESNYEHNVFHCYCILINASVVTLFDKKEAEEYIASHPGIKISNCC